MMMIAIRTGGLAGESSNSVFVRTRFPDRFRYVPASWRIADGTGSSAMAGYSCKASLPLSVGTKTISPTLLNEFSDGLGTQ